MSTKPNDFTNKWKVYFNEGISHLTDKEYNEGISHLTDREYLNYLLKESEKAIKKGDRHIMRFLIWDLQEIQECSPTFYRMFSLIIDSEIKSLERLINCPIILCMENG